MSEAAPSPTPRPAAAQPETTDMTAKHAKPATAGAAEPSIGSLVSDATTQLSTLIHSEIELAKLELRSTVKNAGAGVGLFAAAAVVLVFSLTFGFFAAAEGLATVVSRWAAFLIVFGLQLLAVGLCVLLGIRKVKRIRAPQRTISTTRETVEIGRAHV